MQAVMAEHESRAIFVKGGPDRPLITGSASATSVLGLPAGNFDPKADTRSTMRPIPLQCANQQSKPAGKRKLNIPPTPPRGSPLIRHAFVYPSLATHPTSLILAPTTRAVWVNDGFAASSEACFSPRAPNCGYSEVHESSLSVTLHVQTASQSVSPEEDFPCNNGRMGRHSPCREHRAQPDPNPGRPVPERRPRPMQ